MEVETTSTISKKMPAKTREQTQTLGRNIIKTKAQKTATKMVTEQKGATIMTLTMEYSAME